MTHGYVPLDLSACWNADLRGFDAPEAMELGARCLHGLPFRFGDVEGGRCTIDLSEGTVSLQLPRLTNWIIFAHAVLEDSFLASGSIGTTLGYYQLNYMDGGVQTRPIRQRFEIGPSPRRWLGHSIPLDELSLKVGDGGIGWHIKALLTRRSSRREKDMPHDEGYGFRVSRTRRIFT